MPDAGRLAALDMLEAGRLAALDMPEAGRLATPAARQGVTVQPLNTLKY